MVSQNSRTRSASSSHKVVEFDFDVPKANTKADETKSDIIGVHYRKDAKKWVAKIYMKSHSYYLGSFDSKSQAEIVVCAFKKENPWNRSMSHRTRSPRRGGTSKYKGVIWHKRRGKWMAEIRKDKICKYLGYFVNEKDAARAYDKTALKLWRGDVLTNAEYFGDL